MLSDISMPVMDGDELIAAVRAQASGKALLALACSGYARPQDETHALEAGFAGLIAKPASLAQIGLTVARLRKTRSGG